MSSFHIPSPNVHVVATEATRTAPNGLELCAAIERELGWQVRALSKEEEGRLGALGVLSSFDGGSVTGIVADLGGGSMQLSSVELGELGKSVSLPFGAAALMARLKGTSTDRTIGEELKRELQAALEVIGVHEKDRGGEGSKCDLYVSGGGFRGWGYMLLSSHEIQPYPIPMVGGFSIRTADLPSHAFSPSKLVSTSSSNTQSSTILPSKPFRISARRAAQTPAIALLARTLLTLLPHTNTIYFAQGGVREGLLFSLLPPKIQKQSPLLAATTPYRTAFAASLAQKIDDALPLPSLVAGPGFLLGSARHDFLIALANVMFVHASCTKDIRSSTALRVSTTGNLAGAHGLRHVERAAFALALLGRWGGPSGLPPGDVEFYESLVIRLGEREAWWAGYVGAVAAVFGEAFPATAVETGNTETGFDNYDDTVYARWGEVKLSSDWRPMGKKGKPGLRVHARLIEEVGEEVEEALAAVEKWGKKKNRRKWVQSKGWKVRVIIQKGTAGKEDDEGDDDDEEEGLGSSEATSSGEEA